MLFLLFITSGLFLGWSLGANDAANVFGTAVGSRMIRFRTAALVAGVFVIIGATLQGAGATATLSELGSIDALGGAFTVALCSGLVVTMMTYYKLPVSTSQAIVGAIIGWCFYTSNAVDYSTLGIIASSWVVSPVLGGIFSALLYKALRRYIRNTRTHVIVLDRKIRYSLLIVGAFGAFSLGANNIANVMGVFVNASLFDLHIGQVHLNQNQVLFFLGGLAIATGIFTYGKKVMHTVGQGILEVTPETAIVVVLSQALVLFLFSSLAFSNLLRSIGLPGIPLVPVSSTQVVIGALIGIGAVKGVQEIRFRLLGHIMLGWLLTPFLAGLLTYISLFFVNNVFQIAITHRQPVTDIAAIPSGGVNTVVNLPVNNLVIILSLLAVSVLTIAAYLMYRQFRMKTGQAEQRNRLSEQLQYAELQKSLSEIEMKNVQSENNTLVNRLEEKRRELVTYALSIADQRQFLEGTLEELEAIRHEQGITEKNNRIQELVRGLRQKMNFSGEIEKIYQQAEQVNDDFPNRLSSHSPQLSAQDKKLALLLRIGFSTKEIAPLMNISPKSVEIARYRLRKKLDLKKEMNLTDFIKTI